MDFGFDNLGKQLENMFKNAGKNLSPRERAELNKAQQQVKGLFKGQDTKDISKLDVNKLHNVHNSLQEVYEKLKNGVSDNK